MQGLKVMMIYAGPDQGIRCRFFSKWFKIDFYVPKKEMLFLEIEKINPDVVVIDLNLFARINGIATAKKIRDQLEIPVMFL